MSEYSNGPIRLVGHFATLVLFALIFCVGAFISLIFSSGTLFAGFGLLALSALAVCLRTQWFQQHVWMLDWVAKFKDLPARDMNMQDQVAKHWVDHLAGGLFVAGVAFGVVMTIAMGGA